MSSVLDDLVLVYSNNRVSWRRYELLEWCAPRWSVCGDKSAPEINVNMRQRLGEPENIYFGRCDYVGAQYHKQL